MNPENEDNTDSGRDASPPPVKADDAGDARKPAFVPSFPLVGIGASAGGLDAITALLKRLSCDSLAYVYVQHLAAGHDSTLREILVKHTPAEITVATDGIPVQENHFYVAPAECEITVERGVLRVRRIEGVVRLPIDTFFRSLAREFRSAAITVILSGSGTDGTLGLQAVKDEGGITFVQDPMTAAQTGMPRTALDSGFADFCLTPEEIGDELMRLSAHPYVSRAERPRVFKPEPFQRIFGLLRDFFAVDFTSYKQSSIERRIERRMALHRVESIDEYARFLEKNAVELNLLYHDLLIGVTAFFRDREPFEALKDVVFPRLLENRDPEVPLRVWVPGCSSGEEPYSIAIRLLEFLGDRAAGRRIQIFGTDLDEQSLEKARQGIYPHNIEADVAPARLQRFFSRVEKGYQISRQIREMVVFARHNLGKDPPFSRLELISCRNLLIYLQPVLQKKILRAFHYGLNPAGILLVGLSESVTEDIFQPIDRRLKFYARRNVPVHATFDVVFGGGAAGASEERPRARPDQRVPLTAQQLADRKVIEKYSPPGVVITDALEVVQFRGRTGPYLEPAPGNATLNLLRLVRPELLVELRTTVKRALADALPVSSGPIRFKDANGRIVAVRLDVLPLFDADAATKSLLVLFNDLDARAIEPSPASPEKPASPENARITELERELTTTKEYLQTTIEELETTNEELMSSNEELQSSNEELQSSNEELQSTNEELSTSNEELQSTNEELTTVNDELHHRLLELSISNDDLQNLLASPTNIAIILVGPDLRIRRFSPAAERLLHLVPADVGRPVSYLASAVGVVGLEGLLVQTIATVKPSTARARAGDGTGYELTVAPYKTADGTIRGAVLQLHLSAPRPASTPGDVRAWAESLLAALPRPVLVLDADLRIVWANERCIELFLLDRKVVGRALADAWGGPMDPALRSFLADAAAQRVKESEITVTRPFSRPVPASTRWSVRNVPVADGQPPLVAIVMGA